MKPEKVIQFSDGCSLEIYSDEDPESPRKWDNLGTMICFHKRYDLGDKHNYKSGDYNGWDEIEDRIKQDNPDCMIRPLYLMDHSGLSISMGPFGCPWDSGQIGFIFITNERIAGELKGNVEWAEEILSGEVETYNQYLAGDIYGFILRNKPCEKCGCNTASEVLDSCWGFYGANPIENGIIDNLKEEYKQELRGEVKYGSVHERLSCCE